MQTALSAQLVITVRPLVWQSPQLNVTSVIIAQEDKTHHNQHYTLVAQDTSAIKEVETRLVVHQDIISQTGVKVTVIHVLQDLIVKLLVSVVCVSRCLL